jgi:hypothetical protein
MRTPYGLLAIFAASWPLASSLAQEPLRGPTLQERVAQLERAVATLETRAGLQSARPADLGVGESGVALAARVDALQRSVERLTADIQRVERLADSAARDAAQARREATAAQQSAREAVLRR